MSSLDSVLIRQALAKGDVRQVGSDTPIAIRLQYKGTGSVTSVTVDTGTDLVLVTSDGDTDTYAFGTYTTIGAVVDAINADNIFNAKVLDTVRSEASATQLVHGAISSGVEDGETYYDVLVDTDAADYFAVRLTFDRGFKKTALKKSHVVKLQEIVYLINLGTAAANALKVYEIEGTNKTTRMQELSIDNTKTTINFASGRANITAKPGNDIVVIIADTGNLVDGDGNFLRVIGSIE